MKPCFASSHARTPLSWRTRLTAFRAACVVGVLVVFSQAASAAPRLLAMQHYAGLLAGARPLGRIDAARTLSPEIVLPLRDEAGLDDLIKRLYDPKAALYGHYLKPDEFTDRFGPAVADVNAVAAWAQSKGLRVVSVSPNRTLVKVTGPSRVVEAAFGVQVNTFTATDGRSVYAPDRAITLPTEIESKVLDVMGLDNVAKGKPALEKAPMHVPGVTDTNPEALYGTGMNGNLSPNDVHSIYQIPSGPAYNGSGQTLGLYEEDGFFQSDITTYENAYTGGNVTVTPVAVDGFSTNPTDNNIVPEVTLDIDMLLAMAPSANQIVVYESPGDTQGFQQDIVDTFTAMANADAVNIVSVSYGLSEDIFSDSDLDSAYDAAEQMVSQGQEVCVCTQDDGAYVDQSSGVGPNVSFPGSIPYVTAVGGTDLTDNSSVQYVSETSWADPSDTRRGPHGTGGGGGVSAVWGIPSWQSPAIDTSVNPQASTTFRNMPDVSLYGDFDTGGYSIYLTTIGGSSGWVGYNGTSASCPLWAGFLAVVNQQRNLYGYGELGFASPYLYNFGTNQGIYGRDYHDIADGSNNLYYNAVSGYDNSTGLGSINNGGALIDDFRTFTGGAAGNDDFANASALTADPANPTTAYGNNIDSTFESGEPGNTRGSYGATVWWTWNCPADGTATINFNGTDYDYSVGVYTGSAVNALTQVASNDVGGVSFACTAGVTYSISVDGETLNIDPTYPASEGFITLNLSEVGTPPSNDDFVSAYNIVATPAQSGTTYGTNYGATQETGEPLNTQESGGHSVWWVWTAPGTGTATIDTFGSSYDTTLGVYTGGAVNSLTQIAADDDAGGGVQSQVSFSATAGTVYYISVDGYRNNEGNIQLDVAETGVAAPGNDNFVNRYTINASPGAPGTATGNNAAATSESGEPLNTEGSGGHSVWWTWTAPVSSAVTIDTLGSNYDTTLGVYTGAAVNALTQIASDDDYNGTLQSSVTFNAVAGTTYQISVDGYSYVEGNVTLHVTQAYPTPTITGFTPTSGPVGTHVTITGTHFTGATAVKFHGTTASFSVNSDTQITATVPSAATTGTITVANPSATATSGGSFTVTAPAPTITSISPTSGPVGTVVTVVGTHFTGTSIVRFHNANATTYSVNGAGTQITVTVPTGAGTGTITVTAPGGVVKSAQTFTVTVLPTITSFTPASGPVGTVVTITGTNFTGTTTVHFHNASATTFSVNGAGTQITVTVPTGAGTGTFTVTTPAGSVTTTTPFTVVAPPTITSFTPTSGHAGTVVTLTGTNFTGATSVKFHGTAAASFTVASATSITATVPSGATTGTISVTTPGGTATSSASFTVTAAAPTVTSFTPTSGPVGTVVTVTGTNLSGVTAVRFHNANATVFSANGAGTQLTATVPSGAATGTFTVTTPGGSVTTTGQFTVTTAPAPPTVTSFTPTSGPVGTVMTVTGTNFAGTTTVHFHNASATTFSVNGAGTQITVTVPTGAGTGTFTVTTPGGSVTTSSQFTVTVPPTITSISPTSGPVGTHVTVTGTGFTGTSTVRFHNANATTFTVNGAGTQITVTVPTGAGTGTITVTTPGGSVKSSQTFTVS